MAQQAGCPHCGRPLVGAMVSEPTAAGLPRRYRMVRICGDCYRIYDADAIRREAVNGNPEF